MIFLTTTFKRIILGLWIWWSLTPLSTIFFM
jgi:hypothetical protein